MTNKTSEPANAHGWQLYQHPLFEGQVAQLRAQVEKLKAKHPRDYKHKNATKRLAAIEALIFDIIPQDPSREEYRQGQTLGHTHKHWFRAKFFQQYRLFFRYHAASRIIVYAWVNDESTKRAYESADDTYRVFAKMLKKGNPPSDWAELFEHSKRTSQRP